MSIESNIGYMLIFRGTNWSNGLSAEETQQVVGQWMNWFTHLSEQGKVTGGNPLESKGKIVSGKSGRVVADGPFAESKEAIGGYFMLNVETMDEAVAIAQGCPGLSYGVKVEVRPVMERCQVSSKEVSELEFAEKVA